MDTAAKKEADSEMRPTMMAILRTPRDKKACLAVTAGEEAAV